jgi:hypothetical protein
MRERLGYWRGEDGIVLAVVILALVVLSVAGIAALIAGADEELSGRAMRESAEAFYAAEAGLNQVEATLSDSVAAAMEPGESLDLGWHVLDDGASYHAEIVRFDNAGSQPLFRVTSEGRSRGGGGAQKTLTLSLTALDGEPDLGYCCSAAATVRGEVKLKNLEGFAARLSGIDTVPPAWDPVCADHQREDHPGLIVQDSADFSQASGTTLEGVPPLVEDTTMADSTFDNYGGMSWDSVKALGDFVIGEDNEEFRLNNTPPGDPYAPMGDIDPSNGLPEDKDDWWIGPRYNADGTCNTSHPLNWGSEDPNDPCFDYFPVIVTRGEIELKGSFYGQGIWLMDTNGLGNGAEFELEGCSYADWTGPPPGCTGVEMAGLIIGRGCVEIQYKSDFYGAVYVDGKYPQASCGSDRPLSNDRWTNTMYSSCVIDRVLDSTRLGDAAKKGGGLVRLALRSFGESF